jgi:hypothetical protein
MVIKLVAYKDGFREEQDQPMYAVILNEPTLDEFQEELKDFVEAVELDLENE